MGAGSGFTTNRCEVRIEGGLGGLQGEQAAERRQERGGVGGRGAPASPRTRNAGMRGFLPAPTRSPHAHSTHPRERGGPCSASSNSPGTPHADTMTTRAPRPPARPNTA